MPRRPDPSPLRASVAQGALLVLGVLLALIGTAACTTSVGQGDVDVRIASAEPFTWDPARAGDSGTATVHAQVYEGLTSFDSDSNVQPALASSWDAEASGQRITFELRPGVTYSDGTPIAPQDVVESWLRLLDPAQPAPLASLLDDVVGAADYRAGRIDRSGVGLTANGGQVVVELRRPATYFLAVTASPTLAVVPPSVIGQIDATPPTVVSGAYVPTAAGAGAIRLSGNGRYWAGMPALDQIELLTDSGGSSGVDLFTEGRVDYTAIGGADASWIEYDQALGPRLRAVDSFTVSYYGFNTQVAPFDDTLVRLAFVKAVDWQRMTTLAEDLPANSMIPPGIPGHDGVDHRPTYDPEAARDLLEEAGYPGGAGLPAITLATYGVGYEDTVRLQLEENLGVDVDVEGLDFEPYLENVAVATTPTMWTLSWVADYPHAHDFLGLLLETGSASNTGRWSNTEYDALIEQAAATDDPEEQAAIYTQAQDILTAEAPVVPLSFGGSYALSRDGLLGALTSGVGIIRYASLDWAEGTGP